VNLFSGLGFGERGSFRKVAEMTFISVAENIPLKQGFFMNVVVFCTPSCLGIGERASNGQVAEWAGNREVAGLRNKQGYFINVVVIHTGTSYFIFCK
jgi:hypothetical protein